MSMLPAWAADYVGLPYATHGRVREGVDCWGLVRLVLADVFHTELPDYAERYTDGNDWGAIGTAVQDGLADGWHRVEQPHAGDLLVLSIAARPWHCGLMLGPMHFLHAPPDATSCIDRLDSPRWARRIQGIYRHA